MKSKVLFFLALMAGLAHAIEPGLPKEIKHCSFKTTKTVLARYQGKNMPQDDKSRFLTPDLARHQPKQIYASDGKSSVVSAPDGSFSLAITELETVCGDLSHYTVVWRDAKGKQRVIGDKDCGETMIEISPDSKYILLSGLRYLDVRKWEICPLLGEPEYGFPDILGWSADGNKILIRDWDNWENPDSAVEYLLKLNR